MTPRLVWAGAPMPSLLTASQALQNAGYDSITIVNQLTSNNFDGQFDIMLMTYERKMKGLNTSSYLVRCVFSFSKSLFTRDILHCFFNGGILGNTPLLPIEAFLWKLSGGKLVLFSYGQDGFIYADLPNGGWANALKATYPRSIEIDKSFALRIKKLSKAANCVVGCIVHNINLPRVDVWPVLWYPVPNVEKHLLGDLDTKIVNNETLKIAHPSNHRQIKGTNSLIAAVKRLQAEGLDLSLDVIEGVNIENSRSRMAQADVIVDQLLMGYAMTALEGLALGKIVISGFDKSTLYQPFYELSYLKECPILQANSESIESVLRSLYYSSEQERETLRQAGELYVKHRHSDKACVELFEAIYDNIFNLSRLETVSNLSKLFIPEKY